MSDPNLMIKNLPWEACSCGGVIFDTAVMIKRVSAILSPTLKEEIVPADVIICKSCGKIPAFYAAKVGGIPDDLVSASLASDSLI